MYQTWKREKCSRTFITETIRNNDRVYRWNHWKVLRVTYHFVHMIHVTSLVFGDMQGAVAWRKVQADAIGDYALTALPYINGARISSAVDMHTPQVHIMRSKGRG